MRPSRRFHEQFAGFSLPFLALLLLLATPALAQEGESSPIDSPVGWLFRWLNFAIVLAGLIYALRKVQPYFQRRAEARRAAQAEAERLRAMVRAEAETIDRAAQAEIAAAERAARLELKMVAARLAVERAEVLLRQEMTPTAETALVHNFVAELERSAP